MKISVACKFRPRHLRGRSSLEFFARPWLADVLRLNRAALPFQRWLIHLQSHRGWLELMGRSAEFIPR